MGQLSSKVNELLDHPQNEELMREVFTSLDTNKNGVLDEKEFHEFISLVLKHDGYTLPSTGFAFGVEKNLNEYQLHQLSRNIISITDIDKNGVISFDEFKNFLKKHQENPKIIEMDYEQWTEKEREQTEKKSLELSQKKEKEEKRNKEEYVSQIYSFLIVKSTNEGRKFTIAEIPEKNGINIKKAQKIIDAEIMPKIPNDIRNSESYNYDDSPPRAFKGEGALFVFCSSKGHAFVCVASENHKVELCTDLLREVSASFDQFRPSETNANKLVKLLREHSTKK